MKEPLTQETITTKQAKKVRAAMEPGFAYLARLVQRMDRTFKRHRAVSPRKCKARASS